MMETVAKHVPHRHNHLAFYRNRFVSCVVQDIVKQSPLQGHRQIPTTDVKSMAMVNCSSHEHNADRDNVMLDSGGR